MESQNIRSESVEMYLVRLALLEEEGLPSPVPLPRLAEELDVQTVSANQMVRKMEDAGLVTYQPYKGVSFTEQGKEVTRTILRRRRLWEVFFVQMLGFTPREADELACRMEHITEDEVADRLCAFLEHPTSSPTGKIIPALKSHEENAAKLPLSALQAGQCGEIIQIEGADSVKTFLASQSIIPGTSISVIATGSGGTALVRAGEHTTSLVVEVTENIWVQPTQEATIP